MDRRRVLQALSGASLPGLVPLPSLASAPFDFAARRAGYLDRLRAVAAGGQLPILDIESSIDPVAIDLDAFARSMDRAGVALMCLSVDLPGALRARGETWSDFALEAAQRHPGHFIPAGNGGVHPAWTREPDAFLDAQESRVVAQRLPLMGEFEFRHYPSPRQVQRGQAWRDVDIPIDGPLGARLFAFAERTGIPFQIHYEIEDALLPPLERMLERHPRAKVVWCHLAQQRYAARGSLYGPAMVARWLDRFPNLHFDIAFGGPRSVYPPSGERHARFWERPEAWRDVIAARPWRFLAALDIGGDRMERVEEWTSGLRAVLGILPMPAREIVAWKAGWKLLFGEER